MELRYFVAFVLSTVRVASQNVIELTEVRFTDGNLLFGGTLEIRTPNGWERVCYGNFNTRMADTVCHTLGFSEGAMIVRPAASLGLSVNPLPSLGCQNHVIGGVERLQCVYLNTCDDHAVVTCNYPGYLGCYSHSRSSPLLNDGMFTNSNMTVQTCLTICRHRGYPYAGLAFGQECYCEAHEVDVSKKLGNEDCFLPCVGNNLQICGGGRAAGIYDSRLGSCNSIYSDVEGAISTPGFPGNYTRDEQCTWTIDVPNAVNITVQIQSIELYDRDKLAVATSQKIMSEYVIFTGVPSTSSVHFETSGPGLVAGSQLLFTFTGGQVDVTFNSTVTSVGAQGVVLIYSAAIGESNPPPQTTTTEQPQTTGTFLSITPRPNATSHQPPTNATNALPTFATVTLTTTTRGVGTSTEGFTASLGTHVPTELSPLPSDRSTTGEDAGVTMTIERTVTDGGASSTTPRSISLESTKTTDFAPSIAVIIAIGIGVVLICLLVVTAIVLFTTSCGNGTKRTRRHQQQGMVATNAAYSSSHGYNDEQTDSGIYDPGYDTANAVDTEPIYLSIRNDPRSEQLRRMDDAAAAKRDSNRSYESVNRSSVINREDSVKTTKTDHDYQSVNGVSRKNTEKSYISIYPDREGSIFNGGRVSPVRLPSDSHDVTDDGYMIPTPKNSTQIQITKL